MAHDPYPSFKRPDRCAENWGAALAREAETFAQSRAPDNPLALRVRVFGGLPDPAKSPTPPLPELAREARAFAARQDEARQNPLSAARLFGPKGPVQSYRVTQDMVALNRGGDLIPFPKGRTYEQGQYHSIFDPVFTKAEAEFLLKRNLIVAA
jgi:hypothetical protein